jgi:putative endonuclease
MNSKEFGNLGEDLATKYLITKGFTVLARNYRTKIGEIDLIVLKEHLLVFVEVKSRKSQSFGKGFEAVNVKKQQTLRRVAEQYLAYKKFSGQRGLSMRFDVVDVLVKNNEPVITHIENAF